MKKALMYESLAIVLGLGLLSAQTPNGRAVERLDPALDAIIAFDAKLEQIAADEHFGLTEGPLWVQEGQSGYLLFSDISTNMVLKWSPDDKVSVYLDKSGYTGNDITNVGGLSNSGRIYIWNFGSNGLTLDPQGRLVIAAVGDRAIVRLEKDGTRTVLAKGNEGKPLSGPNDVIAKSDGAVYFTDPSGFFFVKDGKVQALPSEPGGLNGLALSPDEKFLYLSNAGKIYRFTVQSDGTLSNRQQIMDVGTDGMKVDEKGNLIFAVRSPSPEGVKGGVWIASPEGKHLGTIRIPPVAGPRGQGFVTKNMAFGDADGKTLYITATNKLYRIRLKTPGLRPATRMGS